MSRKAAGTISPTSFSVRFSYASRFVILSTSFSSSKGSCFDIGMNFSSLIIVSSALSSFLSFSSTRIGLNFPAARLISVFLFSRRCLRCLKLRCTFNAAFKISFLALYLATRLVVFRCAAQVFQLNPNNVSVCAITESPDAPFGVGVLFSS